MRYATTGVLTLLLSAASPVASAFVIAPSAYAMAEAPAASFGPFTAFPTVFQWVLPASDFGGIVPGSVLTSIGFRLDTSQATSATAQVFAEWRLTLSVSASPFPGLLPEFAANVGNDAVVVRAGPLSIAAGSFVGGADANPFHDVPFVTGYAYTGGPLLVTLSHGGNSGGVLSVDAVPVVGGSSRGNTVGAAFGAGVGEVGRLNLPVTRFGTAARVPEPPTLATFVLALAVVAIFVRRPRNRAATRGPGD